MAPPSPTQIAWRNRLEAVLRLIEPGLNLLLVAGDRLSRAVDRDQLDGPPPVRHMDRSTGRVPIGTGRPTDSE